ncbi:hypothetical protein PHYC_01991 [Phycisphaerales bacterium]|nr:hypothetical protein PHYC_01991 [Phycisphaerales bacterium]
MHRVLWAAAVGSCFVTEWAGAQPFLAVPYCFTQSAPVFRDLFARSRCGTVRGLILGDSQETTPGGWGVVYVPRFQFEFWSRLGNAPETPWMQFGQSTGGGAPYADWLWRGWYIADRGPAPTRLAASRIPPWLCPVSSSTTNGANINNNQVYANLLMLLHDGERMHPGTGLVGLNEFFDRSGPTYLDVLAATNASSGEVRVQVSPSPSSQISFYYPVVATIETSMGLQGSPPGIRSGRVGPLPMGSGQYMQVLVSGTDPNALTDLVTARFVNVGNPRGWAFTSLSAGGYTTRDFLRNHPDCGPVLAAMEPDVVILCYGANDSNWYSPAVYRADIEALIAYLRAHVRPDLPVLLVSDPVRSNITSQEIADNLDAQPGVHYEIAMSDPLVCALNSRRLTHEAGWTPQNTAAFLADGVHYNSTGAALKARLEVQTLFDAFMPSSEDCNQDGVEDGCQIASGAAEDRDLDGVPDECQCLADFNMDGAVNGYDVECVEQAVNGNTVCSVYNPDFNRDGATNGFDVEAVEQAVNGAPCPS